jgi:hypothetical protein
MSNWTLFSNHGHVLVCLARDSEARLRDVAVAVGITERAVQKIVRDLQDGGMVSVTKNGRRNRYRIHKTEPLRHKLESDCTVNDLIKMVSRAGRSPGGRSAGEETVKNLPEKRTPEAPVPPPEKDTPAEHGRSATGRPEAAEAGPAKEKQVKPAAAEKKDRQQGSLF